MHRCNCNNGSFDPKTLIIVETAFDEAWITLRNNCRLNRRRKSRLNHPPRKPSWSADL
jgi:hypothetical protein